MALTPLALVIGTWLGKQLNRTAPLTPDVIEPDGARVIIAGFGRVGQIVGRMLHASGIKITVLDNDPDLIETVRKFGFHVFYGDATRLDLLQAAEADKAILLINAIDDMESSLRLTDIAKAYFPHLKIIGRARNVTHLYELRSKGVECIERETFESSLKMAQAALEQMGIAQEMAQLAKDRFREHNLATLDAIFPYYRDEAKTISIEQIARDELAKSFEEDRIRKND